MKTKTKVRKQRRRAGRTLWRLLNAEGDVGTFKSLELAGGSAIEFKAEAGDDNPPTFSMEAYNGGRMRPADWAHDVVVDLKGVQLLRNPLPILRDHKQNQIVGHANISIGAQSIHAEGVISGAGDAANEVAASARKGFPWQASIGGRSDTEFVERGQSVTVNGQAYSGPLLVARKTVLKEVSFVAVGADSTTSASISAAGGDPMNFEQWLKENFNLEASALTERQTSRFQSMYQAEIKAGDGEGDGNGGEGEGEGEGDSGGEGDGGDAGQSNVSASGDAGLVDSRKRRADELRRIAEIEVKASGHPELAAKAIEEGWSVDKVDLEVTKLELTAMRENRPTGTSGAAISEELKKAEVLECSLAMGAGMTETQAKTQWSEEVLDAASRREVRGYTLHRLMHSVIRAAGLSHPVGQNDNEFIRKSFEASKKLEAQGFSTLSLPGILSNVANKSMLAAYQMYPSVVPFFCQQTSHVDFKPNYNYRLHEDGTLLKLGADGQIKHMTLREQEFAAQLFTYARMIGLSRQTLINDDLGSLQQTAALLGQAAFKSHELAGIELLLNPPQYQGNDFFSVAHGNLLTGAGSALSIDSLTNGETAFATQTGMDGLPISVTAERLMVTAEDKILAGQLMSETRIEIAGTADRTELANNPHAGAYEYRSTPWLSNANVQGSSATVWFLFANPAALAAFLVAYLRGNSSPTIESADASFNTLGIEMRTYWDFGFAAQDPKGAVRSDGQ